MSESNLSQAIFDRVSERCCTGAMCRESVFTEESLCDEFKVSRSPVREALQMLADRRLIEKKPRQGYVVKQLNLTEIHELYDLRLVLETYIVEQVCKTGMDEATCRAEAAWTQVYEALPEMIADPVTADENFHLALASAVGNRAILEMLASIGARIRFVRMFDITNAERLKATCVQHLEILEAIGSATRTRRSSAAAQHRRRPTPGRERRQGGSRERPCDLRLTESGGPRRWDRRSRAANFRCAFTASFAPR